MTRKTLWDTLNSELSVKNIRGLIAGSPETARPRSVEDQLDRLIAQAEAEAAKRGVSTEVILTEMGFDMGAEPDEAAPTVIVEASPAGDPVQALWKAALPMEPEALGPFLDKLTVGSAALERLFFLAPTFKQDLSAASQGRSMPLWRRALKQGVEPRVLLDVLQAEPFFPPRSARGGDFVEFLLEQEILRYKDFARLNREAAAGDTPLLNLLSSGQGGLDEAAQARALGQFVGLPFVAQPTVADQGTLPGAYPIGAVRYFGLVPLRQNAGTVVVATAYAPGPVVKARLETMIGLEVAFELTTHTALEHLRQGHLEQWAAERPASNNAEQSIEFVNISPLQDLRDRVGSIPAVALVSRIIEGAVDARATDIHIEPMGSLGRVRYRIDGICHEALELNPAVYGEVVARLKILADMDITERRRPQDGHIRTEVQDTPLDMRVATVPARGGEKVSIRVANTGRVSIDLKKLGMGDEDLERVQDVATKPFGMVLATGPVGSGKTTTLYSCLNAIDRSRRHVMSIEDPVEINLEGANQVEVNYAIGMDFVQGLRALLRQDPDTILIGEIRDEETARIAVRASMTGLMVFSSLHANTAPGAIAALQNFHIPDHLLANALKGIVAQRLLRRLCPHCKVPHTITAAEADMLGLSKADRDFKAMRGTGCRACMGTGYIGRIGVFEVFSVDEEARDMISEGATERALRRHAISKGMTTLPQDGLRKIQQGLTSLEEFHRVLRF